MKIARIEIQNFRGIRSGILFLNSHSVFVGDNNSGKSTILEAIDLVLGPERLSRHPVIDEHDFYAGEYLDADGNPVEITIEVVLTGLSVEQEVQFRNHLEWWNNSEKRLIDGPPPESTDLESVSSALRLGFRGYYDKEEDDFFGETTFLSPQLDEGKSDNRLTTKDKRLCGFLYLRTLRTGTRALSLERGSLLDIILKLKELKPQMWEDILTQLKGVSVASAPELGISDILIVVQNAMREIVPIEWADAPAIRVSQMTREHLRQILTVFLGTGAKTSTGQEYSAPYNHQGTGTINILVLALLSMIASLKGDVIFAMEEPEIAVPPHTQKRVITSVTGLSSQALFTSHSPYILEEYDPSQIIVVNRVDGKLTGIPAECPPNVKPKAYKEEVKKRFCEALLARRVLIVEGRTEFDSIPVIAKKLKEIDPGQFDGLCELGIALLDAESDSKIAALGDYFKKLGKTTYAIFDKQSPADYTKITNSVDHAFESQEKGFENLILKCVSDDIMRKYSSEIIANNNWPQHLSNFKPNDSTTRQELIEALLRLFEHKKGDGSLADLLSQCDVTEFPEYLKLVLKTIRDSVVCVSEEPVTEPTEAEGGDGSV